MRQQHYSAFSKNTLIAQGTLDEVILRVKKSTKTNHPDVLIFSDETGKQMDFDLSGSEKEVLQKLQVFLSSDQPVASGGPGRPKLGVTAREVSLLPRHWEWLSTQPGGASATLRRLIEENKKQPSIKNQIKLAQERTYQVLFALAGNFPNYEEALRALYAKNKKGFKEQISEWPRDIKNHALKLAEPAL